MPNERMRRVAVLARHILSGDLVVRNTALARLTALYPSWGFSWGEESGLGIFLPAGPPIRVPAALGHAASHIQQAVEGGAVILKDRERGITLPAPEMIPEPETSCEPKTCFERVLSDDEF